MTIVVQDDVIRLEVPVDDVPFVEVSQSEQDLSAVESCAVFGEPALVGDNFTEVTARTKVEDEEELGLGLEGVVQVDNERVAHV